MRNTRNNPSGKYIGMNDAEYQRYLAAEERRSERHRAKELANRPTAWVKARTDGTFAVYGNFPGQKVWGAFFGKFATREQAEAKRDEVRGHR